jgi:hypothetical protein
MTDTSPHNFLLYLRGRHPALARRLEDFRSLGFTDGALRLATDTSGWPGSELLNQPKELEAAVKAFFGDGAGLVIDEANPDRERLPFPITSTKYWNHVAFIASQGGTTVALVMPKPVYAKLTVDESDTAALEADPEILILRHRCDKPRQAVATDSRETGASSPQETFATGSQEAVASALFHFIDPLADLARERGSYVHFLTPFPGDGGATALEARLYSIKEWGTPATPSAIARKFLGRLHYCDPAVAPLGIRLANTLTQKKF